jgi:ribulose-5-phosphate 4-epimerase/fuculose-1-phosphate aldolase
MIQTERELITANHILHNHDLFDGFGHISVRHPENPSVYILSGYLAPALVESRDDLIHYHVKDSNPIDPNARAGYSERFIHGELYKRFPEINCVIHSHSSDVLPYTVGNFRLKPVIHMGAFLGL